MSVDDQIEVKKLVKKSGSSFYWGMNILDTKKKRAMFSIYAFCRVIDDIADELENKIEKELKLNLWKKKIDNVYGSVNLITSVERELRNSVNSYDLEKSDFYSIIDGMLMDAKEDIKFPSQKILNLYCDRVAVAVGYLSIKIFGLSKNEKKYAFFLGRAFQLTNIVRDFKEDLERGRCYISSNYFEKYGIKKNIKTILDEPKIQNIFQDILHEANKYFIKSDEESKKIQKRKIIASEIMKTFYKAIHSKLFKKRINLKQRIKLSSFEKTFILLLFFIRY